MLTMVVMIMFQRIQIEEGSPNCWQSIVRWIDHRLRWSNLPLQNRRKKQNDCSVDDYSVIWNVVDGKDPTDASLRLERGRDKERAVLCVAALCVDWKLSCSRCVRQSDVLTDIT